MHYGFTHSHAHARHILRDTHTTYSVAAHLHAKKGHTHRSRAHLHYHLLTQDTHTLRAPASLAILRLLYRSSSDSSGPSESSLHVLNHPAQSIDGSC